MPIHNSLRNFIQALPVDLQEHVQRTGVHQRAFQNYLNSVATGNIWGKLEDALTQINIFHKSVTRYTGHHSDSLSNISYDLVKGKTPNPEFYDEDAIKQAKMLVSAIREGPIFDQPLYRGIRVWEQGGKPEARFQHLYELKPGDTVEMPGIKSFSVDPHTAHTFAIGGGAKNLLTFVVVGTKRGLPVDALSSNMGEGEVLSFGKFKVVDVHDEPNPGFEAWQAWAKDNPNEPGTAEFPSWKNNHKVFITQHGTY